MKQLCYIVVCTIVITSCTQKHKNIVDPAFADSLVAHFNAGKNIKANQDELNFWGSRIIPAVHDLITETKYAGLLSARFNLLGSVKDLRSSDSILNTLNAYFNYKETGPKLSLLHNAITGHRFAEADSLLEAAKNIGLRKYESAAASFDVDFELGRYEKAEYDLKGIADGSDYGYQFRHSKLWHYKGNIDSAVAAMQKAADLAKDNIVLKQSALSNTADLYLHNGQPEKAYDLYMQSLALGNDDLHSITGIGTIALIHDKNDSLAERIFHFVQTKTGLPDPLFKLVQVAEQRADTVAEKKYATAFVDRACDTAYGNMYNKYTIQLFTGILKDPARAEAIAKNELSGRATPQTYAWYAWALYSNNKTTEAKAIYDKYVSGKPLEGLELYWMGKFMRHLNKGYNARAYFKKAINNRYDLTPAMIRELESLSEE